MANQSQARQPTKKQGIEIVYRNRKIHWVVRIGGWVSTGYLGLMYMIMLTGQAFDLPGTQNEDVLLVMKVLGVVAIAAGLLFWYLAHSMTSGQDLDR